MRIALACLAVIAASTACAHAGEISSDHRGTWTENGECPQPRRIVIGDKTISLVEPGRTRILTDGDEAVFKGETVINASLPAKKQEEPEIGFSARIVEQDGEIRLVTEGIEEGKAFAGSFRKCKETPTRAAARDKARQAPSRRIATRPAPRVAHAVPPRYAAPRYYVYPPGTLLGGLY